MRARNNYKEQASPKEPLPRSGLCERFTRFAKYCTPMANKDPDTRSNDETEGSSGESGKIVLLSPEN